MTRPYFKPATRATRVDYDHDVEPGLRAMSVLKEIHDTGDSVLEDIAAEALFAGREAWWSLGTYHNATSGLLAHAANVDGLETALDTYADDYAVPAKSRPYLLGTLIPLNKRAEAARERVMGVLADEWCQMAKIKRRAAA